MDELYKLPLSDEVDRGTVLPSLRKIQYGSLSFRILEYLYRHAERWVSVPELKHCVYSDAWGNLRYRVISLEKGKLVTSKYQVVVTRVQGSKRVRAMKFVRILPDGVYRYEYVISQKEKILKRRQRMLDRLVEKGVIKKVANGYFAGNTFYTHQRALEQYTQLIQKAHFSPKEYQTKKTLQKRLEKQLQILGFSDKREVRNVKMRIRAESYYYQILFSHPKFNLTIWNDDLNEALRIFLDDRKILETLARRAQPCMRCQTHAISYNFCPGCGLPFEEHLQMFEATL